MIVRFNLFRTEGFEHDVGERTSIWAINGNVGVHSRAGSIHTERGTVVCNPCFFRGPGDDQTWDVRPRKNSARLAARKNEHGNEDRVEEIPNAIWDEVAWRMGALSGGGPGRPSTGSALASWYGRQGHCGTVWCIGFDCFKGGASNHHYFKSTHRPGHHRANWEQAYMTELTRSGRVVML